MAYMNRNLAVIGYGDGFTLWGYATDDPIEMVLKDGYFQYGCINTGDVVYIRSGADTYCRVFENDGQTIKLKNIK